MFAALRAACGRGLSVWVLDLPRYVTFAHLEGAGEDVLLDGWLPGPKSARSWPPIMAARDEHMADVLALNVRRVDEAGGQLSAVAAFVGASHVGGVARRWSTSRSLRTAELKEEVARRCALPTLPATLEPSELCHFLAHRCETRDELRAAWRAFGGDGFGEESRRLALRKGRLAL